MYLSASKGRNLPLQSCSGLIPKHPPSDVPIRSFSDSWHLEWVFVAQIHDADSKTKDPRKHGSGNTNNAPGSQIHNDETYQADFTKLIFFRVPRESEKSVYLCWGWRANTEYQQSVERIDTLLKKALAFFSAYQICQTPLLEGDWSIIIPSLQFDPVPSQPRTPTPTLFSLFSSADSTFTSCASGKSTNWWDPIYGFLRDLT